MTTTKIEGTTAPATNLGARLGGAKEIATGLSGALTAGSRAYVNGALELGRTLGGFGREIAGEAGRHVRATIEARSLREVADLAHTKTMDVIAPFAALLKQDKAA